MAALHQALAFPTVDSFCFHKKVTEKIPFVVRLPPRVPVFSQVSDSSAAPPNQRPSRTSTSLSSLSRTVDGGASAAANGTNQLFETAPQDMIRGSSSIGSSPLPPSGRPITSPGTSSSSGFPQPSYRLVELSYELRGVKDYMTRALDFVKASDSSVCWFCPIECGEPPEDAPLLLFLPGIDGTGLGLIRHYESLGRMFEVRCLHIPITDRTPFNGLMKHVEDVIVEESYKAPSKPIYLVGDSLGGTLALAVAARNPKLDLVLVLSNPATSFGDSQLQPFLPILGNLPDEIYPAVPYFLSFIMGDPIRMALATVDKKLPDVVRFQVLRENLLSMLPMLESLAEIIPKETLQWKIKLLKEAASYTNSRLHAVKAQVLLLASGKDEMLPSRDEAKRLKKEISSCVVRYYKDSGHTLLLEDGLDLGTTIRGAFLYRKSNKMDPIGDFIYPTTKEFEEAYERSKVLRQMTSPVFFSTKEDGTVVQGLDGVPEDGPVLLVGYHMLLGLELTALVTEFLKRKQLIRGVAHPFLMHGNPEEGLTEPGFADDARVFGGFPAGKKAFFKVLSRKECTLLYPGGTREALHRKGEAYRLFWPERSEFVRAAARFGFTIVPFGVVGEDDLVELLLDYNDIQRIPFLSNMVKELNERAPRVRRGQSGEVAQEDLYMPLLAPKVPGRMYFRFGKPFRTEGRELELQSKEAADVVYKEMKKEVQQCLDYLLRKREDDPYRSIFPRILYESVWGGDWQAQTFDP
ncbi:hypothetical protein KP509_28G056300 [Ceratopteris richardii]|uniref:Serine aminopeptidase S33 domain-containing protein n=1 Tax=Ceratopteris richardii TaxID=49495 RepID=A0A8T2REC0_CERRI|nr:hypothetical protein KP509_28G056300 [Ceratopteris richardii]